MTTYISFHIQFTHGIQNNGRHKMTPRSIPFCLPYVIWPLNYFPSTIAHLYCVMPLFWHLLCMKDDINCYIPY